jgi:hypothetical protein
MKIVNFRLICFVLLFCSGPLTFAGSASDLAICNKSLDYFFPKVQLGFDVPSRATYLNTDSTCKNFPFDPFEMPARLVNGSDAHQCLMTDEKRPVIQIDQKELSKYGLTLKSGYIAVANFRHEGKFHIALIPLNSIDVGILQSSKMQKIGPITAGHGQIRIKFNSPIIMMEQDLSSENKNIKTTNELVTSLDAVGAVRGYEPVTRGLNGSYMGIMNMNSVQEKAQVMKQYRSQIVQYPLKLDQEDLKKYIKAFISTSELRGTSHPYNTLNENCGQVHLDVLDGAIDYKKYGGLKPASFSTFYGYINPDQIVKSFHRRGLANEEERMMDFHNDPVAVKEIGHYDVKFLTDEK